MTKNTEVEQDLLRYASEKLTIRDNKYLPLVEVVKGLGIRKEFQPSETKCLIIGGGELPVRTTADSGNH